MRDRIYLVSTILFLAISGTARLNAKDIPVTKPEVARLFSLIVHSDAVGLRKFSGCEFSNSWSRESISKENIKKYLNLNISSDIVPTSDLSYPYEYLQLNGVPVSYSCDMQKYNYTDSTEIGFPIFNATHNVALITLVNSSSCWARDPSGKKILTGTGGSRLLIFRKNSKWKLIGTEDISNWDGLPCSN
jgi:hypothetical protein